MKLEQFNLEEIPERLSKNALRGILGISSQTMYEYSSIALNIPDFESDYPSFTKDSPPLTSAKISRYQAWVIYMLLVVTRELPVSKVRNCLLLNKNPEFAAKFSKQSYENFGVCQSKTIEISCG